MVFFEVVLALAIERIWLSAAAWRRFTWFMRLTSWSEARGTHVSATDPGSDGAATYATNNKGGRARVVLLTLVPAAAVGLIHHLLSESLLILTFIFNVAVLVYCLGPKDLDTQVRAFIHAYTHADKEAARHHLADITHTDIETKASLTLPQMLRAVIEAILTEANERWFAVIFWFVVLGPLGAVFYRLSALLKNNATGLESGASDDFVAAAQHLYAILGWLPARITAISYAIMGSFVDAIDGWNQGIPNQFDGQPVNRSSSNADVVINSGLGALRMHDVIQGTSKKTMGISHVRNAMALVWRTLIFCLGVMLAVSFVNWLV